MKKTTNKQKQIYIYVQFEVKLCIKIDLNMKLHSNVS